MSEPVLLYAVLLGPSPPAQPIDWEQFFAIPWVRVGWFLLTLLLTCYTISRSVTIIARMRKTRRPGVVMAAGELVVLWGAIILSVLFTARSRGVGTPEVLAGYFLLIVIFLVLRYGLSGRKPRFRHKKQ